MPLSSHTPPSGESQPQWRRQHQRRPAALCIRRCLLLVCAWWPLVALLLWAPPVSVRGADEKLTPDALADMHLRSLQDSDCPGGTAALAQSKANGAIAQMHALHRLAAVHWQISQQSQQRSNDAPADSEGAKAYRACVLLALKHSRALDRAGQNQQSDAAAIAQASVASWSFLCAMMRSQGLEHTSVACTESQRVGGPAGGISPWVAQWDLLGPFPHGKTETDGDGLEGLYPPLEGEEEEVGADPSPAAPLSSRAARHLSGIKVAELDRANSSVSYPSDLADGGSVRWRALPSQAGGLVSITHPSVRWNDVAQSISHAALESQSWLVGVVHVSSSGRFTAHCRGVSSFSVDGRLYAGDQYNNERVIAAMDLPRGPHLVRIRVRAKVQTQLACAFAKLHPRNSLRIFPPTFLPDLVGLTLLSGWLSVPVLNLSPHTLRNLRFRTPPASPFRADLLPIQAPLVRALHGLDSLPPGVLSYVPLRLRLEGSSPHKRCPNIFKLTLSTSYFPPGVSVPNESLLKILQSNTINIRLRCRKSFGESFVITFLDADGTISHAGVVPPASACVAPEGSLAHSCPVVLAQHGMGVSASGMADAFKFMPSGESAYRFGVDGAWVLAPARFGAHNHEGPGAACVDAAIEALAALTSAPVEGVVSYADRRADPARIISTGHSMGGHGSWLWSVRHPDRLLCAAPSAGWVSKELYGDSNRAFEEDQQSAHTDGALTALARAATAEDNVDALVAHLTGVPTLVRVGANDRTTHPFYSRRMARLLREENALSLVDSSSSRQGQGGALLRGLVVLDEVGGKEHWWWDTRSPNDGGSMHDGAMRSFWERCLASPAPPMTPTRFRVLAHHAASVESKGGVCITALKHSFQLAEIQVHKVRGGGSSAPTSASTPASEVWRLRTRNVARFSLRFVPHVLTPAMLPQGGFVVDGQEGSPITREDLEKILEQDRRRQERRAAAVAAAAAAAAAATGVAAGTAASAEEEEEEEAELDICRSSGGLWSLCATAAPLAALRRDSSTSGSMRSVYSRPFLFVVGTSVPASAAAPPSPDWLAPSPVVVASQSAAREHTHMAVFLANLHAMASESHVRVVRDLDLLSMLTRSGSARRMEQLSPNLVILGGPGSNAYARALASLPQSVLPAPVEFLTHLGTSSPSSSSTGRTVGYAVTGAPCTYAPLPTSSAATTAAAPAATEGWAAVFIRPLPPMSSVAAAIAAKATSAPAAAPAASTLSACPDAAAAGVATDDIAEGECSARIPGTAASGAKAIRSPGLALHLDGVDSAARAALLRLAEPPIPPMVRPPFTNLAPDYLFFRASSLRHRGWGGISAAGYFDQHWRYQATRAFDTC